MGNLKRNFQTKSLQKNICILHFPSVSVKTLLKTEWRLDLGEIWISTLCRPSNLQYFKPKILQIAWLEKVEILPTFWHYARSITCSTFINYYRLPWHNLEFTNASRMKCFLNGRSKTSQVLHNLAILIFSH